MLSTWGFGCAHGPVGGSLSWGVLELCWQTFCCNPVSAPISPRHHCSLSSETAMGPPCCSMHGWEDPHPLPSPSTPLPARLPPCHHSPGYAPPLQFNPPLFRCTDGRTPQVSWCTVQSPVLGYESLKSCKSKGKGKRNNSHGHDADISQSQSLC